MLTEAEEDLYGNAEESCDETRRCEYLAVKHEADTLNRINCFCAHEDRLGVSYYVLLSSRLGTVT